MVRDPVAETFNATSFLPCLFSLSHSLQGLGDGRQGKREVILHPPSTCSLFGEMRAICEVQVSESGPGGSCGCCWLVVVSREIEVVCGGRDRGVDRVPLSLDGELRGFRDASLCLAGIVRSSSPNFTSCFSRGVGVQVDRH